MNPHLPHHSPVYATKGMRLAGYLLDLFLLYLVQTGGLYLGAILGGMITSFREAPDHEIQIAIGAGMDLGTVYWFLVAWFLNYGVMQGLTGSSFGKKICGVKVLQENGQPIGVGRSLVRTICYGISALPFYLGFAALFFSKKSQCWHDMICKTVVVPARAVMAPGQIVPIELNRKPSSQDESPWKKVA